MPVLIAAAILSIVGTLIGQILLGLSIGFVSYIGINVAMTYFHDAFVSAGNSLPAQVVGILGVLKVGTSLNILTSAIAAKWALQGLKNGAIKKMKFK
ncbi:DUF2523 domain-containing protein [Uliginosibacterium gangwonense]|uniref:DUF2523 domain-containing protein n=1 Tax=Uliginosibacterium gangwonense TaxID=392736 RepID=UPI0003682FB3|nr:DUF2523 domain-containing protein [Uliginosibacterium gangwonense]